MLDFLCREPSLCPSRPPTFATLQGRLLLLTRRIQYGLNVRNPDKLLTLEIFQDSAQCRSTVGCPNYKRMDTDRNDSGLTVGMSLSLRDQFGYVVDPHPRYLTWFFRALQVLPHVDCDYWIGN